MTAQHVKWNRLKDGHSNKNKNKKKKKIEKKIGGQTDEPINKQTQKMKNTYIRKGQLETNTNRGINMVD